MLIFGDGACSGNPGPGGWGSIIETSSGFIQELGGAETQTTNNRMELSAVIQALSQADRLLKKYPEKSIEIFTDSQYVINGIQKWIIGWKSRDWKTLEGQDVSNRDLFEELDAIQAKLKMQLQVKWTHVSGHAGILGNERCDQIAVQFSKGEQPELFSGDKKDYSLDLHDRTPFTAFYLVLYNGDFLRFKTWPVCQKFTQGKGSIRYKKIGNEIQFRETVKNWGHDGLSLSEVKSGD